MRRLARLALLVAPLLGAGGAGDAPPPAPAAGGPRLLRAAETAAQTVVGTIREPARLDDHGWTALLEVERVLSGGLAPGARQRIGWEELAARRPPRFAEGGRVVVALEPLPPGSLWSARFPKRDALAVAEQGQAFLRDPDAATLDLLAAYLGLSLEARGAEAGVTALARLVAGAQQTLAASAVERLGELPGLPQLLRPPALEALRAALADASRPLQLRVALLNLVGNARLEALRGSVAALAQPGTQLEAAALAAQAGIDGELGAERTRQLLGRTEPELRVLAVRRGGDALAGERLVALLRSDPAPVVRVAAVQVLIERRGVSALDTALPALTDPDPAVRAAATRALGGLGDAIVPSVRKVLESGPGADVQRLAGPAMALSLSGPQGRTALREVAASHPDEQVRKLARFALGQLGEEH